MSRYDRALATVSRLISRYGEAVTWNQIVDGDPSDSAKPWAPSTPTGTPVSFSPKIVFTKTKSERYGQEFRTYMPQTEIPAGFQLGLLAGDCGFEPALKDEVIRNGVTLAVEKIDRLKPGDTVIMYYLWLPA